MTEAQQVRLYHVLDAVKPLGLTLRRAGWPAELLVTIEGDSPVVSLRVSVDDTRVPSESKAAAA